MSLLIGDAQWWVNHPDELTRALRHVAEDDHTTDPVGEPVWESDTLGRLTERPGELLVLPDDIVVVSNPAYWLEHRDELIVALEYGLAL